MAGQYMESEVIESGPYFVELAQNVYQTGNDATMKFRHGTSKANCEAASWGLYTGVFKSLGFVQIRLEVSA